MPHIYCRTVASWALILAVIITTPAGAVTRFWIDAGGGDWYDQSNWATSVISLPPASVPGLGDVATFEIGGRTYTVTFSDVVDLTTVTVPSDRVTFDLEGRDLEATQVIHVGTVFNDIGALTLRNGSVSTPVLLVGFNNGDGRFVVENGAVLAVEGSLTGIPFPFSIGGLPTGIDGVGLMEIQGTVNINAADSVVGGRLRGVGTATVDGGHWNTDGSLIIGRDGAEGHVTIQNGGTVVANELTYVGQTGRTNEFVDVTGTGELSITNGTLTTVGTATIGSAENSFGEADLVGGNSAWNIGGFLFVAESGIGNLHVRNEATVNVANDSFVSVGSNEGLLNITTFGTMINDGNMYVGGSSSAAGGPGELLVQSDGKLEVGGLLNVWETGTLTIDGGTITTDNLMIQPGATVNFDAGQLIINSGALNIPLNFDFGGNDAIDRPEIILLNGALANFTDFSLGLTPGTFSSFDINGSTLNASDDINIGGNDTQSLGGSLLSLTSGFANADDLLHVWDHGDFAVSAGHITAREVRLTGGTMSVTGPSSSVHIDSSADFPLGIPGIHVGFAPAPTEFNIENGGRLTAPEMDFSVATDNGTAAFVTVTGPGSSLTTGETHIGNLGDGTLSVTNSGGATFTDGLSIGFAPSSVGTLFIEGGGTKVTSEGKTLVGRQGSGTLMMTLDGAFHSLGDTLIGALAAPINPAPGFVIVAGGGQWVSDQSIYVGGDEVGAQDGGGQIFLQEEGTINNAGTVQVWSTGTLSLEGGALRTRDLLFETGAAFEMVAGSVTVDGGLFRTPSTSLVFGGIDPSNPVAFSFINGANAQTTFAWHIGRNVDTFGETTVRGVANGVPSTLRGAGGGGGADLVVGLFGNGRLDVLDGGLVDFGDDVHIGSRDDATGVVNVGGVTDGLRATLKATRSGGSAGISVGGQFDDGTLTGGTGELNIHGGGLAHVSGDLFVGIRPLSSGVVVIGGAEGGFDAEFIVGDNLFLGDGSASPSGVGSIEIQRDGLLEVGNTLNLRGTGSLIMSGGTLETKSLHRTVPGGYSFQRGTIRIDGGDLVMGGNTHSYGGTDAADPPTYEFVNGALFEIPSSFAIGKQTGKHAKTVVRDVANGVPSTIRNVNTGTGADIVVGESGTGVLEVLDGGLVDTRDDIIIGAQGNGDGTLNVGGIAGGLGATVRATSGGSTAAIMVGGGEGTSGGSGDLTVFDGGLVETSGDMLIAQNVQARGQVTLFGRNGLIGEIRVGDDVFLGGSQSAFGGRSEILLSGGGLLDVADVLKVWPDGFVDMDEGTIRVNHLDLTEAEHGSVNFFLGRIEANQISGDLENFQGTLAPVKSGQGAATLDGNYTQYSRAILEIEMSNLNRATVHDSLHVTGRVDLDGILHIVPHEGFVPQIGEALTIMTYGTRVGEFSAVEVEGPVSFEVIYGVQDIQLLVTDSPNLPGDFDRDGEVGADDYEFMHSCLSSPTSTFGARPPCDLADLTGNGTVDLLDFAEFQVAFGTARTQ